MFNLFGKKKDETKPAAVNAADDEIIAIADGEMIDVTTVSDPVFAQKMMGESTAFRFAGDKVTLCAPANGTLKVLFPTGHAFGVQMKNGIELLVHCGINTVEADGDGFRLLGIKQGDTVRAGDPVVEADLKKLSKKYDMSTMLIVTDQAGHSVTFKAPQPVRRGDVISRK